MGSKPAIERDAILDAAYARAQRDGVASLGIRTIANECGVAVGTIYNYFPDKASLVTEVVGRFWHAAIAPARQLASEGAAEGPGCLLVYCRLLAQGLGESLGRFRASWLREVSTLDTRSRTRSHAAESALFHDIQVEIQHVIENDPGISQSARMCLQSDELAVFIWRSLFESVKAGDDSFDTVIKVLELGLYRE